MDVWGYDLKNVSKVGDETGRFNCECVGMNLDSDEKNASNCSSLGVKEDFLAYPRSSRVWSEAERSPSHFVGEDKQE